MKSPLDRYLSRSRAEGLTGIQPVSRGETVDLPLRVPDPAPSRNPGRGVPRG
jgi:hypothetical protein